jgi:FeS assembly SUF system regulator
MIRLSRMTDYAVTLLTQMVSEGKTTTVAGKVWSASDLAERTGLPAPTVSKILKKLAKSEIITAQRGAAGGYSLALGACSISIASIIEAMDGPIAITDCSESGDHSCKVERTCPMSGNWNKVNQAIRATLQGLSLRDMTPPLRVAFHTDTPGTTLESKIS